MACSRRARTRPSTRTCSASTALWCSKPRNSASRPLTGCRLGARRYAAWPRMSGLHEVDCSGCGLRHSLSADLARKQRVLRCSCGHFVRMDRSLAEVRSDPAPAPKAEPADAEDEQTHLVDSLSALAALGSRPQRAAQPSLSGAERKSQPPPRAPMRSVS